MDSGPNEAVKQGRYTHAIFSDFSGDDGTRFELGSSSCFTLAYVVSREEDVSHNEGVLYEMKRTIACRASDELKYSSLRRPVNKEAVFRLFSGLKVDVACTTVFKKRFFEQEPGDSFTDTHSKIFVTVMQAFPFSHLITALRAKYGDIRPRIVVDQLHWRGTQDTIMEALARDDWYDDADFQFRPSGGTPLLQLADLFCGAVREFSEEMETQALPRCSVCRSRSFKPRDCSWRRASRRPSGFRIIKSIYPFLLKSDAGYAMTEGLYFEPTSMNYRMEFIDCFLGRK